MALTDKYMDLNGLAGFRAGWSRATVVRWLHDIGAIDYGQGIEYMQDEEIFNIAKANILWHGMEVLSENIGIPTN